jgi:hypothetical protein
MIFLLFFVFYGVFFRLLTYVQPRSYFRELRNHFFGLKYLNYLMRIRDTGWKKYGSGMEKIRIRDKHPGSATLE